MRKRSPMRVLPGLLLVMVLVPLDQTALAPALPEIAGELGGLQQMTMVVAAYLAALTAALPVFGKLGDRFGRKPVLLAALALFVIGASACALAESFQRFVAARVLQGLGGGGLMVGAQATIGEIISPRERGRYLWLLGVAYVVPAVIGPLVGGILVETLTWRWIFAIHVPLGIGGFVLLAATLHVARPRDRAPIDVLGATALAGMVVGIVLLASTLAQSSARGVWPVPTLSAGTAIALSLWLLSARSARDPVLPIALLRRRGVAIPMALSFTVGFALFGTISFIPSFARIGMGMTALQSGFVVTALMGGAILTMTVSGRLITKHGSYRRYPVIGTAVMAAGATTLGLLGHRLGAQGLVSVLFVIGLGVGMVMQVVMLAAQNAADPAHLGASTSGVLFLRQVGASVGVALVGALITRSFIAQAPSQVPDVSAITPEGIAALPRVTRELVETAFAAAVPEAILTVAPLLAASFLLALALPALPLRTRAQSETP